MEPERKLQVIEFSLQNATNFAKAIAEINDFDKSQEGEKKGYVRAPIIVYINSYGGGLYSVLGMISAIKNSVTPVYTVAIGAAMSAGLLLLVSGHKRFAYEHATMMCHQVLGMAMGTLQDIQETTEEVNRLNELADSIIVERTKLSKTTLKEWKARKLDKFFTAQESLLFGIIDKVVTRHNPIQ